MPTHNKCLFAYECNVHGALQEKRVSRARHGQPGEVGPNLNRALSLNPLHNLNLNLYLTLALMSEPLANPSNED